MADKINIESTGEANHVDDIARIQTKIDLHQVGTNIEELDPKYWLSPRFLGSLLAIIFVGNSLFFGYAVPVNILNVINADLGEQC
jgi:hypothetical protein